MTEAPFGARHRRAARIAPTGREVLSMRGWRRTSLERPRESPRTALQARRDRLVSTHDALFRAVFDNVASCADLARAALPADVVTRLDLSTLQIEPGSFITDPLRARYSDLLLSVRMKQGALLLHLLFEHKSHAERFTVMELFDSVASLWKRFRSQHPREQTIPRIVPIVVHHGPRPWNQPKAIRDLFGGGSELAEGFAPLDPSLPVVFFDLGGVRDPDREVGRLNDPLAKLALFLLMVSRTHEFVEHLKRSGFGLLREVWHAAEAKQRIVPVLDYVLHHVLEEVQPAEFATMLHEHVEPEVEATFRSLADVLFDEGKARGKAEGRDEGKIEGETLAVLRILAARFGPTADSLREELDRVRNSEKLLDLAVAAANAKSLESFASHLRAV